MIELHLSLCLEQFELRAHVATLHHAIAIVGPSGAGKTSLLECIAGVRSNVHGQLRVNEQTWFDSAKNIFLKPEQRHIGYVPQDNLLFPHLNVAANITFGFRSRMHRIPHNEEKSQLHHIAEQFELTPLLHRMPHTLSGGEQRRVALARALILRPHVLLLDEPLSGLNDELKFKIMNILLELRNRNQCILLWVTHDQEEAQKFAYETWAIQMGIVSKTDLGMNRLYS